MKKTIGILGGMGPAATVDLFSLIVNNTVASCDQEHIHIIIDNNPKIPDRTAAIIGNGKTPVEELCASAERLYKAGADFIIIPCNTSHYYINEIRSSLSIPVIDMIEETAKAVRKKKINSAIILCTEGTKKADIYTMKFEEQGISVLYPDQIMQDEVNHIIYDGVKKNTTCYDVSTLNILALFA